jgi:outer membrane biosynthesis protein TonB
MRPLSAHSDARYRQRVLTALTLVLGGLLLIVHVWPAPSAAPDRPFSSRSAERIQIRDVQPTRQPREQSPPPPAPRPPVVVPNNRIVDDERTYDDGPLQVEVTDDDATQREGTQDPVAAPRSPDTGARLLRTVQPRYPSAARDDGIRARVRVEVFITETGTVREATVIERWQISTDGQARPVGQLGHGLEAAALTAARRALFRPAHHNGAPVASRTTLTFTFGK